MTTTQSVHLQGIGRVTAKPAGEIRVGDDLYWNYGIRYTVVAVEPCGTKSVNVTERSADGKQYTRRMLKTRLVAAR